MLLNRTPYELPAPPPRTGAQGGRMLPGEVTRRTSPPPLGVAALEDDEMTALAEAFRVALHNGRAAWQRYVDACAGGRTFLAAAYAERAGGKGHPLADLLASHPMLYASVWRAAGHAERAEEALEAYAARPETQVAIKAAIAAAQTERVTCFILAAVDRDAAALAAGDEAGQRLHQLISLRQWITNGTETSRPGPAPIDARYARAVAVLALSVDRDTMREAMRFPEVDLGRHPHLAPLVPVADELGVRPPTPAPTVTPAVRVMDRRASSRPAASVLVG